MELTLFWDEAVPGNPLSPDLSRKAGLTYATFPDFPITFLETSWLTLACCRTEDMQKVSEDVRRILQSNVLPSGKIARRCEGWLHD